MFLNVGGCSGLDRSVQIVYGTDGEGILQLEVYWKNVSIIPRTLKNCCNDCNPNEISRFELRRTFDLTERIDLKEVYHRHREPLTPHREWFLQ